MAPRLLILAKMDEPRDSAPKKTKSAVGTKKSMKVAPPANAFGFGQICGAAGSSSSPARPPTQLIGQDYNTRPKARGGRLRRQNTDSCATKKLLGNFAPGGVSTLDEEEALKVVEEVGLKTQEAWTLGDSSGVFSYGPVSFAHADWATPELVRNAAKVARFSNT